MAVGKRIYAATCYIPTPKGDLVPGQRVAEDDPRFIKELSQYYEAVDVAPKEPTAKAPAKK
jgi:hypothetical protein